MKLLFVIIVGFVIGLNLPTITPQTYSKAVYDVHNKLNPDSPCLNGEKWKNDGHGFIEQVDDKNGNKVPC